MSSGPTLLYAHAHDLELEPDVSHAVAVDNLWLLLWLLPRDAQNQFVPGYTILGTW